MWYLIGFEEEMEVMEVSSHGTTFLKMSAISWALPGLKYLSLKWMGRLLLHSSMGYMDWRPQKTDLDIGHWLSITHWKCEWAHIIAHYVIMPVFSCETVNSVWTCSNYWRVVGFNCLFPCLSCTKMAFQNKNPFLKSMHIKALFVWVGYWWRKARNGKQM